jgi:hypothetical protein
MFGGGPYSTAHSKQLRMIGRGYRPLAEIIVKMPSGGKRNSKTGGIVYPNVDPYMPKKITDPYHPGGNSVCYMIQTAHLMGCDPIYLLGFTLMSGSGYHFGMDNPVTRRRSFYEADRPLTWLRWYEKNWPGRVRLWPDWQGPIYEVFQRHEAQGQDQDQSDPEGGDVPPLERHSEVQGRASAGDDSARP